MKKDTPKQKARKENRQIKRAERKAVREGTKYEPKLTKRDIRKFSK